MKLTPTGAAYVIAALIVILAISAAKARRQRNRKAIAAMRRREDTPLVRRMLADTLEECNTQALRQRRGGGL